jgi:hypothetical protein
MTLIGAIRCLEGAVILADGQETITDYAKWAVNKIKSAEINGLRVVMAGCGDADGIEMVWEKVSHLWGGTGSDWSSGFRAGVPQQNPTEWREQIANVVRKTVRKSKTDAGLIWVVQDISGRSRSEDCPFEAFRTSRFTENNISRFYFDGNPILLAQYLSDFYLKHTVWGLGEARTFAAYILWEAKEYDPTVGKQSDVVTITRDGNASRMPYEELSHWEDHFRILKREMSYIPMLSFAGAALQEGDRRQDRLGRFVLVLEHLIGEQEKMRSGKRENIPIDKSLIPKIRKHTEEAMKKTALKPSSSHESGQGH